MILLISGSHPRHIYLAKYLAENIGLDAWIIEKRETFLPSNYDLLNVDDQFRDLYRKHFLERLESEKLFFNNLNLNDPNLILDKICKKILICDKANLNSPKTSNFIKVNNPEICISYGCHVLHEEILRIMPESKFNLHGGLSPWYRGCITHFWPSYFLEPQMTGMTMHKLTNKLDGGEILHQNSGVLNKEDGIHDLACRTVKSFIKEIPTVINLLIENKYTLYPQKSAGKLWLAKDWGPQHLDFIYNVHENKLVKYCIENNLVKLNKKIIRSF